MKKTSKRAHKGVSLGDELDLLADSVEAAQVLAESVAAHRTGNRAMDRAPRLLASMLALVEARLRLTRQAIVGGAAPSALAARHNRRGEVEPGEDPDVVLPLPSVSSKRRRSK